MIHQGLLKSLIQLHENQKSKAYKLNIDKFIPVPVDLSKLCDQVKNKAVKITVYDKLVSIVNTIYTTNSSNLV